MSSSRTTASRSRCTDFADPRIAKTARWDGDPRDFRERIAAARTFGFAHEVEALAARGLASHVAPESVVVFAPDAVLFSGRPFTADEPARHKLLDLAGDLFVHGGPPIGRVIAHRPGHAATHAAMRDARSMGIVVRRVDEGA
jgi:UDP-3-O-[3-hydroxymyristoyl] N-acetylglucosamine deacetylase